MKSKIYFCYKIIFAHLWSGKAAGDVALNCGGHILPEVSVREAEVHGLDVALEAELGRLLRHVQVHLHLAREHLAHAGDGDGAVVHGDLSLQPGTITKVAMTTFAGMIIE